MNFTLIDIFVITSELVLVLVLFLLFWWVIRLVYDRVKLLPWVRSYELFFTSWLRKSTYVLMILWAFASSFILCINIILLTQGQNLLTITLEFINQLSAKTWVELGHSLIKSMIVLLLTALVQTPLSRMLDRASKWLQNLDRFAENDLSIDHLFKSLKNHLRNVTWLIALLFCSQSFGMETFASNLFMILKIYFSIAIGLLMIKVSDAVIDSLDAFSSEYINHYPALKSYTQLRTLIPFLKRILEYVIYLGIATLSLAQIRPLFGLAAVGAKAIKVLGIILASRILVEVSALVVTDILIGERTLSEAQRKRHMTLVPILQSLLKYGVYFWSGLLILNAVEVDPTPILAAAGVLGLAVGLGAQNLINDAVSGFFILFENYYLVGDYIEVEGAEGIVEAIELRTTHIRHPNGQLQILRNGDITSIRNFSREYIYAVVDVGVAYDSDLNKVYRVIEDIGLDIQKRFPKDVLEPTEVDGLEAFGHSKLIIRSVTKLKPNDSRRGVHDDIQSELRKIIKEAFECEGIIIPTSQAVDIVAYDEEI